MEIGSKNQMEKPKEQFSNGIWQQGKSIGRCMEEMFKSELWTDVKFQCKDHDEKGTIKAHKIVLAARSSVFEAMFFGPCADGKSVVEMKHIDSVVFLEFLRYVYSDTVNITEEIVFSLIETAHLYQVECLVEVCAEFLCTILSSTNACNVLTHALRYGLENLRNICCSFIDNNTEVLKSDSFINLPETVLLYILKGDTFYTKEEDIIEAAEKWSRKRLQEEGLEESGENIRTCLGQAFYQLRIPTLTNKSLLEFISRKGYLSIEEYSDIAAFINNVDGIAVMTNSCVVRIPETECIIVNSGDSSEVICDVLSMSFELSLEKDVALKSITLNKVRPYFKNLFKSETLSSVQGNEESTNAWRHYENRNSEFSTVGKRSLSTGFRHLKPDNFQVKYDSVYALKTEQYKHNLPDRGNLPENMDLTLSGSTDIETLNFSRRFDTQQQQHKENTIDFNPPLLMKKIGSPHLVKVKLRYKCGNGIQIQTIGENGNNIWMNEDGRIQILQSSLRCKRQLTGIKSLKFQNISNRENSNDLKMNGDDT